jgi:hypothetical protein
MKSKLLGYINGVPVLEGYLEGSRILLPCLCGSLHTHGLAVDEKAESIIHRYAHCSLLDSYFILLRRLRRRRR